MTLLQSLGWRKWRKGEGKPQMMLIFKGHLRFKFEHRGSLFGISGNISRLMKEHLQKDWKATERQALMIRNAQTGLPRNRQQRRTKQLKWSETKTLGRCSTHVYESNQSTCWYGPEINPSVWIPPSFTRAILPQTKVLHTHRPRNGIFLTPLVGNHQPVDLCEAHKYFCVHSESEESETESVTCWEGCFS